MEPPALPLYTAPPLETTITGMPTEPTASWNVLVKVSAIDPLVNATASLDTRESPALVPAAPTAALDTEPALPPTALLPMEERSTTLPGILPSITDASATLDFVVLTAPSKSAPLTLTPLEVAEEESVIIAPSPVLPRALPMLVTLMLGTLQRLTLEQLP